ncbi:hypothetical protein NHX12_010652 [Muraenolepis orangiensis]|uniref:Uncharacterized protein n=1 Tax=Muraenolepis orangiensis TaxID=630683 RepID=A0A9Q0IAN8_9TELE|nr:hypothetical protein NHX12_010652 [Muraenolepis orangiensis]
MAAIRDPAGPVLIIVLSLLASWSGPATSTRDPSSAPPGVPLPPEDYYDVDENDDTLPPRATPFADLPGPLPCKYDPCLEEPCSHLAGCLCPGVTLESQVPEAPGKVRLAGRAVGWCAPYSLVTGYRLHVAGEERLRVDGGQRSGKLEALKDGDRVCVFAENAAGVGPESCVTYRQEGAGTALTAGLVGGALGLALLLALAVLLWKYAPRRTSGAGIATQDTADSRPAQPHGDRVTLDVL